jgi:hypothetical protein
MASARPVYATEIRGAQSSPDSGVSAEGLPVPNETSPLLQHKPTEGPQQNVSERLPLARVICVRNLSTIMLACYLLWPLNSFYLR